jgi:hypothetical protein
MKLVPVICETGQSEGKKKVLLPGDMSPTCPLRSHTETDFQMA